jgi:hypothetical protein
MNQPGNASVDKKAVVDFQQTGFTSGPNGGMHVRIRDVATGAYLYELTSARDGTNYVVAEDGKEFEVVVEESHGRQDLRSCLRVDGSHVTCRSDFSKNTYVWRGWENQAKTGVTRFKFCLPEVKESSSSTSSSSNTANQKSSCITAKLRHFHTRLATEQEKKKTSIIPNHQKSVDKGSLTLKEQKGGRDLVVDTGSFCKLEIPTEKIDITGAVVEEVRIVPSTAFALAVKGEGGKLDKYWEKVRECNADAEEDDESGSADGNDDGENVQGLVNGLQKVKKENKSLKRQRESTRTGTGTGTGSGVSSVYEDLTGRKARKTNEATMIDLT